MKTRPIFWLYIFIQNLTFAEKSHLRKQLKKSKGQEIKVFEIMDKSPDYDERSFIKKIERLSYSKAHLACKGFISQWLVLLESYYSLDNETNEHLEEIQRIRYLKKKKLYKPAIQRLQKLKKQLILKELNNTLTLALNEELSLIKYIPKELRKRAAILKQLELSLEQSSLETKAFQILDNTENLLYRSGLAGIELEEKIDKLLIDEIEKIGEPEQLSILGLYYLNHAKSNIYIYQNKYEEAFFEIENILKEFDKRKHLKEEKLRQYVQSIINYCNRLVSGGLCKEINDLDYVTNAFKNISAKINIDEADSQYIKATIAHAKYSIYISNWELKDAYKMSKIIESCEIPMQENEVLFVIYNYEFAQINFYLKNFDAVRDYCNNILSSAANKIYPDLYLFSRLLYLFVLVEESNTLSFTPSFDAFRKALAKFPINTDYIKTTSNMLQNYMKSYSEKEKQNVLAEFKNELHLYENEHSSLFMFFNIHKWIEEKEALF